MSRPQGWRVRNIVAHHEAGHAVAAIVMGWPFRYVALATCRPQTLGHVVPTSTARRMASSGRWEPELVTFAAGMAAEDLAFGGDPVTRRAITRDGRFDLRGMQVGCRHAWHRLHTPENYPDGAPPDAWADPAWSVADIAGAAWRRAVELVWVRWPAVVEVADALARSSRALTQPQVRRMVEETPVTTDEDDQEWGQSLTEDDLVFWPAQYSRLAWRPFSPSASRARPTSKVALVNGQSAAGGGRGPAAAAARARSTRATPRSHRQLEPAWGQLPNSHSR